MLSRFLKLMLLISPLYVHSTLPSGSLEQAETCELALDAPLYFKPLLMERIWGGRRLEIFGKTLPANAQIGESWEITDREDAQSVVQNGIFRGKSLHDLWVNHHQTVFGTSLESKRFPVMIKLLDAKERLSVQVHPTPQQALLLNGEPKTEMWYFVDTYGDGDIFAGLRKGVTVQEFTEALYSGSVAEKIHRLVVHPGEAFFIPSGRIHAIGAGNVIVEVQQNSDTTYRVFDWNRLGLNGQPRELHIEQSLQCINFKDYEPAVVRRLDENVVTCEYFNVDEWEIDQTRDACLAGTCAIFVCLSGEVLCGGLTFKPGEFFLVPAALKNRQISPLTPKAKLLRITLPESLG